MMGQCVCVVTHRVSLRFVWASYIYTAERPVRCALVRSNLLARDCPLREDSQVHCRVEDPTSFRRRGCRADARPQFQSVEA